MNFLRIFFIGGVLAYRALFGWISPWIYIPTMLGSPLFQILFFAYIGRASGVESDTFFVVGNAIQVAAMAGVFGMAMAIGGERSSQTLASVLATPANRLALFLGRALPMIANGVVVSAFGFAAGWALLDFNPPASDLPMLVLIVLVTSTSCTAFGVFIGSIGLAARDVFVSANLAFYVLLVLSGANIPDAVLPAWLEAIGDVVPLSHGIDAARQLFAGAPLRDVFGSIGLELVVAGAYGAAGYALLRVFERVGRRRASFETV